MALLRVHVHGSCLAGDDAHALAQSGRRGNVHEGGVLHVDHAVVRGHDGPHASGQATQQLGQPRVELFEATDPRIRSDAGAVAGVVDLGPVEVDDGRSRTQLAQSCTHAVAERLCGHMARSPQRRSRQPGTGKARGRDDGGGHVRCGEALKVGGRGLPLGGRRPTLHGQQVHDAAAIGNGEAHHVGGARARTRAESRDSRGRRRGDNRMDRANIVSHAAQRRSVPQVILDQLVPKPIHKDEERLLSPGLDPEGACRLR